MFHGDRWAAAFISTLGENAGAGLACLKALVPPVKTIPCALFGLGAALQLERLLRDAAGISRADGGPPADKPMEYAIRFISLLVEKDRFRYIDPLLRKIEKKLDDAKGILELTAESAFPMDSGFQESLRRKIEERTGAGIIMHVKVVPALLGGYRLRIGEFSIDASLKGQLEKMADNLGAISSTTAGRTGGLRSAEGF
ncbi:MAG: F0F1 ATP synthase subunit delta [Treponema sp.]|jgi:F-type H+-transporting ATPase subunit delta|nr:F0F1 ATP synthase subunit delta [Treponema sp.]